jgi:DNA-binding NarL/FixJ family response regulator
MNKRIVACVEDLFFRSKIDAASRHLDVPVQFVSASGEIGQAFDASTGAAFIELSPGGKGLEAIRKLKGDASTRGVPLIGFLSHVDKKLADEAARAGVDRVMPRSQFSENLSELLLEFGSPGAKRTIEEEPELPEE